MKCIAWGPPGARRPIEMTIGENSKPMSLSTTELRKGPTGGIELMSSPLVPLHTWDCQSGQEDDARRYYAVLLRDGLPADKYDEPTIATTRVWHFRGHTAFLAAQANRVGVPATWLTNKTQISRELHKVTGLLGSLSEKYHASYRGERTALPPHRQAEARASLEQAEIALAKLAAQVGAGIAMLNEGWRAHDLEPPDRLWDITSKADALPRANGQPHEPASETVSVAETDPRPRKPSAPTRSS